MTTPTEITSLEALRALYPTPQQTALVKETGALTPEYRRLVEASRFAVLYPAPFFRCLWLRTRFDGERAVDAGRSSDAAIADSAPTAGRGHGAPCKTDA